MDCKQAAISGRKKEGVLMAKFDFSNDHLSIVDAHNHRVDLSSLEAVELFEWLSDKRAMLLLSLQDANLVEQLEIHLQPQDLIHLHELQAAIPLMQEYPPATKIFVSPVHSVSEHALELLEEFQIEYHIHPLLEDTDVFAQG
jgi:hypothetical protein